VKKKIPDIMEFVVEAKKLQQSKHEKSHGTWGLVDIWAPIAFELSFNSGRIRKTICFTREEA
jgi:hypothetical protein